MQDTLNSDFISNVELMSCLHPLNKDLILKSLDPSLTIEEDFDPPNADYLNIYEGIVIYGIQNGHFIKTFLSWLDAHPKRRLIICESCPKHYAHFFNQASISDLICHERVHFILTPDGINQEHLSYLEGIFSMIIMTMNLKNALFLEHKQRHDSSLTRKMHFEDALEKGLSDYYSSEMYLKGHNHKTLVNYYENLSIIQDGFYVGDLKDAFKNQPIVLCAAGFSLPKIYDKLHSICHHTLIAAAGTGASLLFKNGIDCHFNAILDVEPNHKHTSFYHNHQGVLFYLLRSGQQAVTGHQGFKVNCDTYFKSEYLKNQLADKNMVSLSSNMYWTVTDFLLEQLIFLGFSPIYLCGIDHIMDKTKYYAEDVIKIDKNNCSEKMYVHAKNIHGKEVLTKFDWHQGSKKINDLCLEAKDTTIIYVTDEGLPIPHAQTISTQDFCLIDFPKTQPCEDSYIPTFLKLNTFKMPYPQILKEIEALLNSFTNCKKIFEKIDIELGKHFFAWQISSIDALNPYTGIFFHLEKMLHEEKAYTDYLLPAWEKYKTQIHIDAGFYGEAKKAKLTLFALKTRELDFLKHHNLLFHNLFVLQKDQILARSKKFSTSCDKDQSKHLESIAPVCQSDLKV